MKNNNENRMLLKIPVEKIINSYRKIFNIDVSYLFNDIDHITLNKCKKTKYFFFEPKSIAGDSNFYKKLEDFIWYYQKDKWEFDVARNLIDKGSVLEIGCGYGNFLESLKVKEDLDISGCEFNPDAIHVCMSKGLNVNDSELSMIRKESFDFIVTFQVLEHIPNTEDFFFNCNRILKKNGQLIIGVPNSKSLIFKPFSDSYFDDGSLLLNLPPHHMGWWDERSLKKMGKLYGFKTVLLKKEPFNESRRSLLDTNLRYYFRFKLVYRLFKLIFRKYYKYIFNGESLLIVFVKEIDMHND